MRRYSLTLVVVVAACARGTAGGRDDTSVSARSSTDLPLVAPAGSDASGSAPSPARDADAEPNCDQPPRALEAGVLRGPYPSIVDFCKDQGLVKCRQDRSLPAPVGMGVERASLVLAVHYGQLTHLLGIVRAGQWHFSEPLRAPDESIMKANFVESHLNVLPMDIQLGFKRREHEPGSETVVFHRDVSVLCGFTPADRIACVRVPTNHVAERQTGPIGGPNTAVRIAPCADGSLVLRGDTSDLGDETALSVGKLLGHRRVTFP